jgi:hypothetical protein
VRIISFVVMIALARLISPQAFGVVAYASVFIAFAQIFVDQGFSDAIVQFADLDREHLDTAFWVSLLIGGLLSVMSVFGAQMVAVLFREPQLVLVIKWLSPIFFLGALSSVQQAILRQSCQRYCCSVHGFPRIRRLEPGGQASGFCTCEYTDVVAGERLAAGLSTFRETLSGVVCIWDQYRWGKFRRFRQCAFGSFSDRLFSRFRRSWLLHAGLQPAHCDYRSSHLGTQCGCLSIVIQPAGRFCGSQTGLQ